MMLESFAVSTWSWRFNLFCMVFLSDTLTVWCRWKGKQILTVPGRVRIRLRRLSWSPGVWTFPNQERNAILGTAQSIAVDPFLIWFFRLLLRHEIAMFLVAGLMIVVSCSRDIKMTGWRVKYHHAETARAAFEMAKKCYGIWYMDRIREPDAVYKPRTGFNGHHELELVLALRVLSAKRKLMDSKRQWITDESRKN